MRTSTKKSNASIITPAAESTILDFVLGEVGSTRRTIISIISCYASAFCTAGVAASITNYVAIASYMSTGSLFIAQALYILGLVLAAYAAIKTSQVVFTYLASGDIDRDLSNAKARISGWLSTARKSLAAA